MKLLATLLTLSAIYISACDKPATSTPTSKAPSPPPIVPLASQPLGHFRVTILRDRHIDRATTQPGPIETVKTYPREIFQQAEFYVPAGAESRTIAPLPDGRIMILEFRDLQLTAAAASAIQWGFDANFQIGSDSGHQRDWPMARADPPSNSAWARILSGYSVPSTNATARSTCPSPPKSPSPISA